MAQKAISREDMIKKLVAADLNGLTAEKSVKFLERILHSGWKGYNEMSDKELMEIYEHKEFRKEAR